VERCRVLELGCAGGGNLIPMALGLPDSTFTGIDLSIRQVADGQRVIDALGLTNVTLRHMSIQSVDDAFGCFDYILCHGVYSWVAAPVQQRILAVCRRNLAADGVAYVSYNTYPGWHMRGLIRDMMAYHAQQFAEPRTRVQQARNLLDFLARSAARENSPYSLLLNQELQAVRQSDHAYLFHEHLEEVNEPIYFHHFAERAAAHGLRYLGEVDLRVMVPANYPPEVASVLQMLSPDLIHLEQYMDFLRNRMFRQTLLCHTEQAPSYGIRPERLTALHVAAPLRPMGPAGDLHSTEPEQFEGQDGVTLTTREPIVKAALRHLAEFWPRAVPFAELRQVARKQLEPARETASQNVEDTQRLGECLLQCYMSAASRLVDLHVSPPRFALQVSERPRASPLARLQAASGNQVTNLRHESVGLGEFERQLLRLLDGRHDRAALLDRLTELTVAGALRIEANGQPVRATSTMREHLGAALDRQLPLLARQALLQA
jgi:methyltransferase-like protein/SAM-dependent methyltransferase